MSSPADGDKEAPPYAPARDEYDNSCSMEFQISMLLVLLHSFIIISLSNLLHSCLLRRLGQPSAISQMLAGFLIGPSVLGQLNSQIYDFNVGDLKFLSTGANIGRVLFMFLIGLEMDINYLLRSARAASITAGGGAAASFAAALASFEFIYRATNSRSNRLLFFFSIALVYANTASPIVVRMVTELKLAYSEVGRLIVTAALVNDMACLLLVSLAASLPVGTDQTTTPWQRLMSGLAALCLLAVANWFLHPVVEWLNKKNEGKMHVELGVSGGLVLFVMVVSAVTEFLGYNSTMASFLMGLGFPRQGTAARTLVFRLSHPVNNYLLPVFFGYMGANTDVTAIKGATIWFVGAVLLLTTAAKVSGTMVATWYLGKTVNQGLVTGFLLNVKGHVDLLVIAMAERTGIWEPEACMVMLVTVVLQMLTAAPIAAAMVKLKQKILSYHSLPLECTSSTEELRLLLCIYGPRDVPTMLNLVEICGGSGDGAAADGEGGAPVDLYLLHLVELTKRITNSLLIHHQDDRPDDQECYCSGEDARVIAAAADIFRTETGISARQATAVSETITMHQDVYNAAVDIRASLLLLPFHKHQRVDGRMQDGRKQVRAVNEQIMRCAPCTVGVLIDRGLGAPAAEAGGIAARPAVHHVAVLFFGGGDDREALAFGLRLSFHPSAVVTVVRFLPPSVHEFNAKVEVEAFKDRDVLLAISKQDRDRDKDEAFFSDFFNRYVVSGQVLYMEKYVENGAATVTALSSMEGMFSLFLVGKGINRNSPFTLGLSDWEEFPELGSVADLLASSDFLSTGSVLVLQQCVKSKQEDQNLS